MTSRVIRVAKVTLGGFRGVNTSRDFKFGSAVTLLFGPNGVGKTSILQGVEWSLTGILPYLSGPDFVKEDAIVNLFNRKVAAVQLDLKGGDKKMACTRSRKMAKSTSRGSSTVDLRLGEEEFHDDDAQRKIEELIGIGTADFGRTVCLHQESIRDLLSAKPEERSRAIDKLLGTYEIRELAEALDVKHAVTAKTKAIQERIDSLSRDKIQFAVNMRARLAKRKGDLLKSGFKEQELKLGAVAKETNALLVDVSALAGRYKVTGMPIRPSELDLKEVIGFIGSLESSLKALDRQRTKLYNEIDRRKQTLEVAIRDYSEAKAGLDAFADRTVEKVEAEEKQLTVELKAQEPRSTAMSNTMGDLISIKRKVSSSVEILREGERERQEIMQRYKEAGPDKAAETYGTDLGHAAAALEGFSKLSQLTSLAVDFISSEKPPSCPVCEQEIQYNLVLQKLKQKAETAVPTTMKELRTRQQDLERSLVRVRQDQKDLERIENEAGIERGKLGSELARASRLLGETIQEGFDFDSRIDSLTTELKKQSDKVVEIRTKLDRLQTERKGIAKANEKLSKAEAQLQALCGKETVGETLLEDAKQSGKDFAMALESYGDTTELDLLSTRLGRLQLTGEYLKDEEELDSLEKELPTIEAALQKLESAKAALLELAGSLGAIRQAALEYEETAVSSELSSLGKAINQYYSRLLAHPVFQEIALVIEKKEPLIYSIKAEGKEGSTYIPTRFSNAQMNCVAIALFLANNQKMATDFGTVLMDDPTQSMDPDHKRALATIIGKLAEDKQVIIATQDKEFKEFLTRECDQMETFDFGAWSSDGPSKLE